MLRLGLDPGLDLALTNCLKPWSWPGLETLAWVLAAEVLAWVLSVEVLALVLALTLQALLTSLA